MFKSSWTETLHSMANSRKHEKIRSTLLHYIYKIPHNWLTGICLSPATQAFLKKWKHARQHWFTIFLALCIYCYPYHSIHIIDIYICESIYLHWSLGLVIHAMHTHVNIRIWYLCVYIYIYDMYMHPMHPSRHKSRHQKKHAPHRRLLGTLWPTRDFVGKSAAWGRLSCDAWALPAAHEKKQNMKWKGNMQMWRKKREEQRIHFLFWIWKIEIWKIEFTKIHLEFLITTRRHWKIIIWKVDMIHLSWGIDFFHTAEMPSFNRLIRLNRKFGKSWHVGQNDGKDETNIILASKLHHFDPLRQRRNL